MKKKVGNKAPKGFVRCRGCGNLTPSIDGFRVCNICLETKTSICQCGCEEVIPYYTKLGLIRKYKDTNHASQGTWNHYTPEQKHNKLKVLLEHSKTIDWSDFHRELWKNEEYRDKKIKNQTLRSENRKEFFSQISKNKWKNNPEGRKRFIENIKGSGNPNWNGGLSEYDQEFNDEFKDRIRARQNYECADKYLGDCCISRKALSIHHINRVKTETTSENCIALCNSHHTRSHNEKARIRHREYNEQFQNK